MGEPREAKDGGTEGRDDVMIEEAGRSLKESGTDGVDAVSTAEIPTTEPETSTEPAGEESTEAADAELPVKKRGRFGKILVYIITGFSALLAVVSGLCRFIVILFDIIFSPKARELMPFIGVTRMMFVAGVESLSLPEAKEAMEAAAEVEKLVEHQDELAKGYAARKAFGQTVDYGLSGAMLALLPVLTYLEALTGLHPVIILFLASSVTMLLATVAMFFGPVYGLFHETRVFCVRRAAYRAASIFKLFENVTGIPFLATKSGFTVLDTPPVDAETLEEFKDEMRSQANEIRDKITQLLGGDTSDKVPERAKILLVDMLKNSEQELGDIDFRTVQSDVARDFALIFYELENRYSPWRSNKSMKIFAEMNGLTLREAKRQVREIVHRLNKGDVHPDFLNSVMMTGALRGLISREKEYSEVMEDLALNQTSTSLALGCVQYIKDLHSPEPFYKRIWRKVKSFLIFVFALPIVIVLALLGWLKFMGLQTYAQIRHNPFKRGVSFIRIRFNEIRTVLMLFAYPPEERKKMRIPTPKVTKATWKKIGLYLLKFIFIIPIGLYKLTMLVVGWVKSWFEESEEIKKNRFQHEAARYALAYMFDEAYKRCILEDHLLLQY